MLKITAALIAVAVTLVEFRFVGAFLGRLPVARTFSQQNLIEAPKGIWELDADRRKILVPIPGEGVCLINGRGSSCRNAKRRAGA